MTIKTDEEALEVLREQADWSSGDIRADLNRLHAYLTQRLAAVDGWLPIESAPRKPVLLYYPELGTHPEMFRVDHPGMTPRKESHWRPLPPAPSRQEG